jgi:osmotically-inducible protein OsmY
MTNNGEMYKVVMDKLEFEPRVNASNIMVSVQGDNDIVILGGEVDSYAEKLAAEKAVKDLAKVRTIANEIKVNISTSYKHTDVEIATSVNTALKSNIVVSNKDIQAVVKDGVVTLTGHVDWNYQRISAFNAIKKLFGIKSIINNIEIQSARVIYADTVKAEIIKEFERHARIDAKTITIDVDGSKVTLKGTVRNYDEVDDAEDAAWSVAGIKIVQNDLIVEW